jgi:hypothetical protein
MNWFAAHVIGQFSNGDLMQSARIKSPSGKVYAAVYAFDKAGNLSEMSNMVEQ